MRWWNKKKGRDNWTRVQVPMTAGPGTNLVTWCKQQPSDGKFYRYIDKWYFEKPQDATYFLLKWS